MVVVSYNSFNDFQRDKFFKFCQEQSKDISQPAHVNMWSADWEDQPHTLPYILSNTNRYRSSNGDFNVVFENDEIIGCAGVYKSTFSNYISIAGCRLWIDSGYRNFAIPRNVLLPVHKQWSLDNDCKAVAITFNEYNKNLIQTFKRTRLGESSKRISSRESQHLFFTGLLEVDFPVNIQYTKQWVAYEQLDPTFVFDWNTIKWK
jgi:hypothetical protein